MRTQVTALLMLTLASLAGPAAAADAAAGEKLHQEHCVSCHSSLTGGNPSALYTRAGRKVTTLAGLRKQVERCELSLGLKWFEEDVNNVAAYLNQAFYHFTP